MYDRKKYKNFALKQLKGRWGVAIGMTFLITLITSLVSIPTYFSIFKSPAFYDLLDYSYASDIDSFLDTYIHLLNQVSQQSTFIRIVLFLVEVILIVASLNVYLKLSRSPEKVTIGSFFEGFNNCGRAILGGLWCFLWTFLWSLLFFIPGIIKGISYSQMFYIIAEYKNVSVTKAMNISKIITNGHKWDLFVTGLSFLGWELLCVFTCGIGNFWLTPYMRMTYTNAYHAMLKEAIETNKIHPEDLA